MLTRNSDNTEGVAAYIATKVDNDAQRLYLSRVEGGSIPAEVPVIIYAPQHTGKTLIFREAETEATDLCEGNILYGTLTE